MLKNKQANYNDDVSRLNDSYANIDATAKLVSRMDWWATAYNVKVRRISATQDEEDILAEVFSQACAHVLRQEVHQLPVVLQKFPSAEQLIESL